MSTTVEGLKPDALDAWVGRTQNLEDDITQFPVRALAATLDTEDPSIAMEAVLPPLWHWLYFLPVHRPRSMRHDGHAQGGDFMPPVDLPRRVWAGSKFIWNLANPMRIGDRVRRISRIDSIMPKHGSSGQLVFVTIVHEFHNAKGLSLANEHTSAFREAAKDLGQSPKPVIADTEAAWHRVLTPDPVLLFRYSALTFNSHRIHYDHPYAREEEGYPAPLVQGPLISTLLMDLLHRHAPAAHVRRLQLKAMRPSFVGRPMHVRGTRNGDEVRLWAADDEGRLTMAATAEVDG